MAKTARAPVNKSAAKKPASKAPSKIEAMVADLTVAELDALIKAATARKDEQMVGARTSFIEDVRLKAASLGVSLMELVGQGPKPAVKAAVKKSAKPPARKSPEAKYRNPASGETWSGRGRTARWMAELEAKGHKREEFAV